MFFGNTRNVLKKIVRDLDVLRIIADLFLQAILILLCAYNIYTSIDNLIQLIIYSLMGVVVVFWFIYCMLYYFDREKTKKIKLNKRITKDVVKYIKLSFRLVLIIYSSIIVFSTRSTTLSKALVILSIISFVIQIFLTIITKVVAWYVELLSTAFEEDFKPYARIKDVSKNIFAGIKDPIYGISSLFVKEEEIVDEKKSKQIEYLRVLNEERKKQKQEKEEDAELKFLEHKKEIINKFKQKFFRKKDKEAKQKEN